MIRPIVPTDTEAIITLAQSLDMFDTQGLEYIRQTLDSYHQGNDHDDQGNHRGNGREQWYVADNGGADNGGTDDGGADNGGVDNGEILGVIYYCAPEPMTQGTWNILMLLVCPEHQGQGYGKALIQHLEQILTDRGERLVIVETSSLENFQGAQAFYRKCGYQEEGRIKHFYDRGNDKIIFSKILGA